MGRIQGFGKLTPPKAAEVLRSFTRELISVAFAGNSLRGTWTGGGITISMSNSDRYMARGGGEASLLSGSRHSGLPSMHRDTREVEVAGGV